MNETPQPQHKIWNIVTVIGLVLALGVAIGLWQLNSRVQELSDKVDAQPKTKTEQPSATADTPVELTSGKGGFAMTVPGSWGPLLKATESDFFIMSGTTQPALGSGVKAKITESAGYGSDAASVFAVMLSDAGMGDVPQGSGAEFTIGKGDDALVGKKYSYVYPQDEVVGVGHTRYQGDRKYLYTFATKGGKKLEIVYNVYGSDPRNFSSTVDDIVRSITVK